MKAKETASEPSRTGRLSLGWSGKGCCEETRKKFTFQSGGGERRADKNGNRGGESSGKFKSSSKEGTCSSSLFDERRLCFKIIFISGVHNVRTDPATGYSLAPAPPPLDPSLDLTRRPFNLNVCNRLFMIKTTEQHCHNFIYYIFHEFFSWYSKIWTTTHPLELICSPLLLLAYTRFSVWITVTVSGEK